MPSQGGGIATGQSADPSNAVCVTQAGEVLRSEPDWHIAQDDNAFRVDRPPGRVSPSDLRDRTPVAAAL